MEMKPIKMNDFIIKKLLNSGIIEHELNNNNLLKDIQLYPCNINLADNVEIAIPNLSNPFSVLNKIKTQGLTICVTNVKNEIPYRIELPLINTSIATNFMTNSGLNIVTVTQIMQIISDLSRKNTELTYGNKIEYVFYPCSEEDLLKKYFTGIV